MRRALLLLPRLQPCSPAVARTFSSKASVTLQTPDAEVDATEDHSRESMVSSDLDKHLRKFDEIALSEYFCARFPFCSNLFRQVANTVALMEEHLNGLRSIKARCHHA